MTQVDAYSEKGGRNINEDSFHGWHKGDAMCFVVADGLGGHGHGDVASQTAVEVMESLWDGEVEPASWEILIRAAHNAVRRKQNDEMQMKTTVVGLMLQKDHAVWAHAGDSRLYHFYDGKLVFQTEDHSVSQLAVLMGRITKDQIRTSEDRSSIFKALGQEGEAPAPQIQEQWLEPGKHAFLLCSDGFWEYVLENEMEQDLQKSSSVKQWLAKMRERIHLRASANNDNNTAIAIWLELR